MNTHDDRHDAARILDHEYDGIREFDNPTPGWWHAIFFASVI
ncbi:MAG: cbb3-type cytochrome c oxidase N-terminal domain-containing protein, partial [bacterium]